MPQVVIKGTRETPMVDDRGRIVQAVRVEFMIGEMGPFLHHFPREGFNAASAKAELERFAREIALLAGTPGY